MQPSSRPDGSARSAAPETDGLRQRRYRRLAFLGLALLWTATGAAAEAERLGLVLGGGGARGGAHIGVLKELEARGIFPEIVVGTSFGALIGGLYAAGYTPAEIETAIDQADFAEVFTSLQPRRSLSFRRKQDDQELLAKLRLRFQGRKAVAPQGLVSSHRFRLWLARQIGRSVAWRGSNVREFRAVTTDLLNGEQVLLGPERLEEAIYGSMAFPGLLEPLERDGRLLVDGGLVNNLPVSVAFELGATKVIAVDVGTPYPAREDIKSSVDVVSQISKLMVRGNVERTMAALGDDTLLLEPDVDFIATGSFRRIDTAVAAGQTIARERAGEIEAFAAALPPSPAAPILTAARPAAEPPTLTAFDVRTDARLSDGYMRSFFDLRPGERYEERDLYDGIDRLYGTLLFERIDFDETRGEESIEVQVDAVEKPGRGFMQFGIEVQEDFETTREYEIAVGYTQTQINRGGGEWRSILTFGEVAGLQTEFFQPLGRPPRYFVAARGGWVRPVLDLFDPDVGFPVEQRLNGVAGEVEIGRFFDNWGQLSLTHLRARLFADEPGLPSDVDLGSLSLAFERDTLDSTSFPNRGERVVASHLWSREAFGSEFDGERAAVDALRFVTRGRNTLGLWGTAASTLDDDQLAQFLRLGGFLNLSGLDFDRLAGRHLLIARGLFYRRLAGHPLSNFVDLPVYLGTSLELGNVWQRTSDISLSDSILAGSVFFGLDSVIGPLFLSYGYAEGGERSLYFSLGRPFIYDLSSTFD